MTPTLLTATSGKNLRVLQQSQNAYANAIGTGSGGPNTDNLKDEQVDFSTRGKVLTNLPLRIRDLILKPYPWQLSDTSQRFGAIGTLVAYALLAFLIVYALGKPRQDLPPRGTRPIPDALSPRRLLVGGGQRRHRLPLSHASGDAGDRGALRSCANRRCSPAHADGSARRPARYPARFSDRSQRRCGLRRRVAAMSRCRRARHYDAKGCFYCYLACHHGAKGEREWVWDDAMTMCAGEISSNPGRI